MKSKKKIKIKPNTEFAAACGRALRRAARVARKTAKIHGTKLYYWKNGRVVAVDP